MKFWTKNDFFRTILCFCFVLYTYCRVFLKKCDVFFFGNQNSKLCPFENKKVIFRPNFHFVIITRVKTQQFRQYIFHLQINVHIFCSPYRLFLPYQLRKTCEFIMYGSSLLLLLVLIRILAILKRSIKLITKW